MSTIRRIAGLQIIVLLFAGCAGVNLNEHRTSTAIADKDVESVILAKSGLSWDGNILPKYPEGQPEISILRIKIPSGATLPMHKHPMINAGFMLEGELTVETESGAVLHLKAGEAIIAVVDMWHSGRNEGRVPADIVVFYAGSDGLPVSEYKNK